jgi:cardiolipin synthase
MSHAALVTIAIAFALLAAFLGYALWGRSRRRDFDFSFPGNADLRSLMRSMAGLTWGSVSEGNRVTIVQNSGFFDALLEDVAVAKHHVHLETFLWQDSNISDRITAALCAKARAGVEVRVLVDSRGSKKTSPAVWAALNAAGCDFRVYHRARFREFAMYNKRDHRKIAVIDGRIGYTFGHGMADMWGGTPAEPTGWRDTAARIEGPAVNDLQSAFFENWVKTAGVAPLGDTYFPRLPKAGKSPLHVAFTSPRESMSAVQRIYYMAIAAAQHEIILQNPYFLPDRRARQLFCDAAKRGVAISIMLPTSETSDFPVVQHASHYFYGALLDAGIRVMEHVRSGLHQKVMIVDGIWCAIGSTNFDPRSFRINEEITVAICDADVASELRAAYVEDVKNSDEWSAARWHGRDLRHRIIDRLSALLKRQL